MEYLVLTLENSIWDISIDEIIRVIIPLFLLNEVLSLLDKGLFLDATGENANTRNIDINMFN